VFEGEWYRSEKNGFGTYSYANGDRYGLLGFLL
jgi:hypothetical protein